jgi:flagellar biosynthesis/type III secretory pathway M-ring protein FliF/YscJ
MTLIQWLALAVVGVVLGLFVLRPLIAGLLKPAAVPGENPALAAAAGVQALPGAPAHMIGARDGVGSAGSSPLDKIGEIVSSQPEEAAGIIRNWISEGAT